MTLPLVIDVVLMVLAMLACVPALVLFVELIAALYRVAPTADLASGRPAPTFVVLMPAHDEAGGISAPIAAVLSQLGPSGRLLVVADNCSDDTAAVARRLGAEVVERHDPTRRGKGYALDFGVRALAARPPEVVLVVDADCIVGERALHWLATVCVAVERPVQALYLMHAPPGASLGLRIAELAWLVKNKLRPLGAATMGAPCQLMGTGMAFSWTTLSSASLASGHLVEDMQLGLELASAGTPPQFCPQALVSSVFPADRAGAATQRTRWEHGHLSMIATVGPRLLGTALRRTDGRLLAMALDLMVPPLASLVLVLAALMVVGAGWSATGHTPWPMGLSTFGMAMVTAGVLAAWHREGRAIVSLKELSGLPWYVIAKVPVYIRLFTKRQTQWIRTRRDDR